MAKCVTHVILRPFTADGRECQVGEAVDASHWKNVEPLVAAKYLRPATDADKRLGASQPASRKTFKIRKSR